jgi:hypothetical protein
MLSKKRELYFNQQVYTRTLIELGADSANKSDSLALCWRQLADELLSFDYREALSAISGVNVCSLPMKASFWRYEGGSQLPPHTDTPNKALTHLMYFNDDWTLEQGGCFRILNSNDADDCVAEIPPKLGTPPADQTVLSNALGARLETCSTPCGHM